MAYANAVYRIHPNPVAQPEVCWKRRCLRMHQWNATCECGWIRTYRRRWHARRMLISFHVQDNHGGVCD